MKANASHLNTDVFVSPCAKPLWITAVLLLLYLHAALEYFDHCLGHMLPTYK